MSWKSRSQSDCLEASEVKNTVLVSGQERSLGRLFLFGISLCNVRISTSCSTLANAHRLVSTYVVACFFIFITLLVLGSFGLIWSALLVIESLPSFAEDLADLACEQGN